MSRHLVKDFAPKRSPGYLSNVPSEFIRQVVADIRWVLARPEKFKFDLGVWCSTNGKCTVCAAGAAIIRRYGQKVHAGGTSPGELMRLTAVDAPTNTEWLLYAANHLREFNMTAFINALREAGLSQSKAKKSAKFLNGRAYQAWFSTEDTVSLHGKPSQEEALDWCKNMLKLAKLLEEAGL